MLIQLPDFAVPHLDFSLKVDRFTDPLVFAVDSLEPSSAIILFLHDFYKPLSYVDGKLQVMIARATMHYLGNGFHPFEVRATLPNGHVLTTATGHISVYLVQ
jgi:hypothetical protein